MTWEKSTETNFNLLIEKIPFFMQAIAREKISKKAEANAQTNNRTEVIEKDMVDAFFSETPGGFLGPMKCDLESLKIDYTKYGYERDDWRKLMGG